MKIKKITYINLIILLTFVLVVCEAENEPPTITSLTADPGIIEQSGNSTLTCLAEDPDSDNIEYTWQSSTGSIAGEGPEVIWTAPASVGAYTITCTVEDGNGGQDIDSVSISVVKPFDIVGIWDVTFIEGSPVSVDSENSEWTFEADGTYQWFILLGPFDTQGGGNYSLNGKTLTVDGIITETFGTVLFLTVSNNNNTFSLLDNDGQTRALWIYNRRVQ